MKRFPFFAVLLVALVSVIFIASAVTAKKNRVTHIAQDHIKKDASLYEQADDIKQQEPAKLRVFDTKRTPIRVTFMRLGEIWVKDLLTGVESKISNVNAVSHPSFSPTGKFIYYTEIIRARGGFPTTYMYLSTFDGKRIKKLPFATNQHASKLFWSQDDHYLGIVFFDVNEPWDPSNPWDTTVQILDTSTYKLYKIANVTADTLTSISQDIYLLPEGACDSVTLSASADTFCNEYVQYLKNPRDITYDYFIGTDEEELQMLEFINTTYTKEGFKYPSIRTLQNGLVLAQFYSGTYTGTYDPDLVIPGYDAGITETYTVLLSPDLKEITTIDNATSAEFFFE